MELRSTHDDPSTVETTPIVSDKSDIDVLHEIGSRIAAADPLHTVLNRVVQFV